MSNGVTYQVQPREQTATLLRPGQQRRYVREWSQAAPGEPEEHGPYRRELVERTVHVLSIQAEDRVVQRVHSRAQDDGLQRGAAADVRVAQRGHVRVDGGTGAQRDGALGGRAPPAFEIEEDNLESRARWDADLVPVVFDFLIRVSNSQ